MSKLKKKIPFRMWILLPICLISLLVVWVLTITANHYKDTLIPQHVATRWKEDGAVAQISCFFSVNTGVTPESIEEFEHNLDSALEQASIVVESPHASARLWADAYSASGKISVKSNIGNITTDCLGIGGDFFLFHPLPLLSGSYFSGNDVMQDYCVLDREAAWKLFGSNDVAGQIVYIADVAHVVTGVVEHEDSDWYKAAGLDNAMIYVSYDSLKKYGSSNGINHFEILMPNPVKGYAKGYVQGAIGVPEEEMELVENSARYDFLTQWKHIGKLSTRSMNGKAIIYPYWENVARAMDDRLAYILLFRLLFLAIVVMIVIVEIWRYWKHKKWTVKGVLKKAYHNLTLKMSRARQRKKFEKQKKQQ